MLALLARGGEDGLRRARLPRTALRLLRQLAEQIAAELPVTRIARPVDVIIAGALWRRRNPFGDRALIEAGGLQFGRSAIDTHRGILSEFHPARHFQLFGRRSMTRLALPCERSIVPGSSTRTVAVTPT